MLAVIVTSAAVAALGWGGVATVSNLGAIPRSLPLPAAPLLRVVPSLLVPALSRLALMIASVVMAVTIVAFAGLVGYIAMPALAGLLILVGWRTIKPEDLASVWRTGTWQKVVLVATFAFTVVIPLQHRGGPGHRRLPWNPVRAGGSAQGFPGRTGSI